MCTNHNALIRILRSQGLCREAVQRVYSSIIIGKHLYAVSSWWGFASAAQLIANACRQYSYNVASRIRSGLCSPETHNLTELAESVA